MAKSTLNVNSVNNYMENYKWDEDYDDFLREEEKTEDDSWLFSAGYTIDKDGKVVPREDGN